MDAVEFPPWQPVSECSASFAGQEGSQGHASGRKNAAGTDGGST